MIFLKFAIICASAFLFQNAVAKAPSFRILAPSFVCPRDKDAVFDKPDKTIITLQTEAGVKVKFNWTVRWQPLVARTQPFALALWRTARALEHKLNGPQIEPNVYIINNTELLSGVNYIFNVTAAFPGEDKLTEQIFHIDNMNGDHELLIEGRSEMFAIILIGGQMTYSDLTFVLEAQVTSCYTTHDYYFVWSVESAENKVELSDLRGGRLLIRENVLTPGLSYDVVCMVFKYSNQDYITQTSLPFQVEHRDLKVNFNIDEMVITVEKPFSLQTDISNLDFFEDGINISWTCMLAGEAVDTFYESDGEGTLTFPQGFPDVGEYLISVTVSVLGQTLEAEASVRVIAVSPPLPVIHVHLRPRVLNEDIVTTLIANVSDVMPGCSVMWYFKSEKCLAATNSTAFKNCGGTKYGRPISAPVTFHSLEKSFLGELTDYTNETSSKIVFAHLKAAAGMARIVAECNSTTLNDTSEGVSYADVYFQINYKPVAGEVLVMPETGTAMETVFRLSTLARTDPNRPLRYTFYCRLNNNESLILGSYQDHMAVETFLPYTDGGTVVWVEVCDSLGACSLGKTKTVLVRAGDARTMDALIEDARAHILRCEIFMLRRLATSAIVTYINAHQIDALNKFSLVILDTLKAIDEQCAKSNYDDYSKFLNWMAGAGIDTTSAGIYAFI